MNWIAYKTDFWPGVRDTSKKVLGIMFFTQILFVGMMLNNFHNFRDYGYEDGFSPYLHVFVHHSKEFLQLYGSLKPFEMEGVEKLNHSLKMAFYRATNHGCSGKPISEQVSHSIICWEADL